MSLLGSSGIWRRFQDNELKDSPVFLHLRDEILQFEKGKEPERVDGNTLWALSQTNKRALYIMDANIDKEHSVYCQSLWVTSARRPETRAFDTEHFKRAKTCKGQFFVPWNEKVKELHKFGGTARLVLQRDEEMAEADMKDLENALQSADALRSLKVFDLKDIGRTTHLLVKLHPNAGFRSFDVQLSSPYVQQQLVQRNWFPAVDISRRQPTSLLLTPGPQRVFFR